METRIILNRIKCPDGTILTSHYRHDFQEYTDENGIDKESISGGCYLFKSEKRNDQWKIIHRSTFLKLIKI